MNTFNYLTHCRLANFLMFVHNGQLGKFIWQDVTASVTMTAIPYVLGVRVCVSAEEFQLIVMMTGNYDQPTLV